MSFIGEKMGEGKKLVLVPFVTEGSPDCIETFSILICLLVSGFWYAIGGSEMSKLPSSDVFPLMTGLLIFLRGNL